MSDLRLSVLPPAGKDGGACGTRGVLPKHHASAFRSVATRRVPRRACARERGQTWNLSSSEREPVRARFSAPHPVARIPHSTASAKQWNTMGINNSFVIGSSILLFLFLSSSFSSVVVFRTRIIIFEKIAFDNLIIIRKKFDYRS